MKRILVSLLFAIQPIIAFVIGGGNMASGALGAVFMYFLGVWVFILAYTYPGWNE